MVQSEKSVSYITDIRTGKLQEFLIENNTLTMGNDFSLFLHNHQEMLEIFCGDRCSIEISGCRDVTVYCDSDCSVKVLGPCDIEVFAEDNCSLDFSGQGNGGRIVCGSSCTINCWSCVSIECGSSCKINCDRECSIECRKACSIKGPGADKTFFVHCEDDCSIVCGRKAKIDTKAPCRITRVE